MADHIHKVAVIGAGGNLGGLITRNLINSTHPQFHVTVITRTGSTSIPSDVASSSSVTVTRGDYEDHAFLVKALQGQEVFHWSLGFAAPHHLHETFVRAAAEAHVPYLIPTEFGSDSDESRFLEAMPILQGKRNARQLAEKLGVSSWIGFVTNPWYDYAYHANLWNIDPKNKKATLYDSGNVKANTTLLSTAALAVAKVLSLPKSALAGQPSLEAYKNKMLYIRSFHVSQKEILEATQKVVGSDGWDISETSTKKHLEEGIDQVAKGDLYGNLKIIVGATFTESFGNIYRHSLANKELGLPDDDFEMATKKIVEGMIKE